MSRISLIFIFVFSPSPIQSVVYLVCRLRELHSLHTKGPYQVCCETPGTWHWDISAALHRLSDSSSAQKRDFEDKIKAALILCTLSLLFFTSWIMMTMNCDLLIAFRICLQYFVISFFNTFPGERDKTLVFFVNYMTLVTANK